MESIRLRSSATICPRQCGIATFTTDLVEALSLEAPDIDCWAAAMNDKTEGYAYPEKVRISRSTRTNCPIMAWHLNILNIGQTDIVCVQHEYGLFGGPAGGHLLKLLGDLRMPVVTTLHTVLKDPAPEYRAVMCKLADLSDKLVVMSHKAVGFLKDIYGVPEEKIAFIHHGIPDTPFIDSSFYTRTSLAWKAKRCCSPSACFPPIKALKMCCRRFPEIIKKHPDVVYIVSSEQPTRIF